MTLKRSGSFINLAGTISQCDRLSAVSVFSFLGCLKRQFLAVQRKVVQAEIEKVQMKIG
jgi:hypothetical protein